jgi:hypothetical protein
LNLSDLLPKLQNKVERSCGGVAPDSSVLVDMLERARFEYSTYTPSVELFDFTLAEQDTLVVVLKDGEPAEVVSAMGVYIRDSVPSFPLAQGHGNTTYHGRVNAWPWQGFDGSHSFDNREMPSILFTQAAYRDAYYRTVSYVRNDHVFRILRPPTLERVEGVIMYGGVRAWADIPRHDERLILDRATAEFIDDTLILESAGVIRIPTPNGPFEFDGGRTLLALRDRLLEDFRGRLMTRMSHLSQG